MMQRSGEARATALREEGRRVSAEVAVAKDPPAMTARRAMAAARQASDITGYGLPLDGARGTVED